MFNLQKLFRFKLKKVRSRAFINEALELKKSIKLGQTLVLMELR